MKVILYMATTMNGYIAKEDGGVEWTTKENWDDYFKFIKQAGNLIIGRGTYDIMPPDEFIQDCLYVVMTKSQHPAPKTDNVIFTNKSPKEVLQFLTERGHKEIVVGGGSKIDTAFMKEDLIDEVYLNVEPVVLGKGLPLFFPTDFEAKLELLEINKLSKNTIQLHYQVKKRVEG